MNQSICGTSMCSPNLLCSLFCFWHHTRGCSVVRVILDPISLWSNSRGGCGVRVQYLLESTCKSGRKNLKCDLFKNLRNVCLIGSFFVCCYLILRSRDFFASFFSHGLPQRSWALQHVDCLIFIYLCAEFL